MATIRQSSSDFPYPWMQISGVYLPYDKITPSYVNYDSSSVATTDLYTIPANYIAYTTSVHAYNSGASSNSYGYYAKISGTYYRACTNDSASPAVGRTINIPFIFKAGETIAITTSNASATYFEVPYLLIPTTFPLNVIHFTAPTGGNDTIYTVPANTTTIFLNPFQTADSLIRGTLVFGNSTGAGVALTVYYVPNGGAVGTSTQIYSGASVSNGVATEIQMPVVGFAGDSIVITSTTATDQIFSLNYIELPATL